MSARAVLLASAACLSFGCMAESKQIGNAEPFRVRNATFVKGELPGIAPDPDAALPVAAPVPEAGAEAGSSAPAEPAEPETPELVGGVAISNLAAFDGQGDFKASGNANLKSVAVGIALEDVGSGYWVLPVGNPSSEVESAYVWSATLDFDASIEPGAKALRVVALAEDGSGGLQIKQKFCVRPRIPDAFGSCQPTSKLPNAIISLVWDTNVDLDLQVRTPDGLFVDPKNPLTVVPDGGPIAPEVGKVDRDSNAGCVIDGTRVENLVWEKGMPSGLYTMYANLFSACGKPSVKFTMEVYTAEPDPEGGTKHFRRWFQQSGELLDFQANGGSARGLFVGEFLFQ